MEKQNPMRQEGYEEFRYSQQETERDQDDENNVRELPGQFFTETQHAVVSGVLDYFEAHQLPIQIAGSAAKIAQGLQGTEDRVGDIDVYTTESALMEYVRNNFGELMPERGTSEPVVVSARYGNVPVTLRLGFSPKYGGGFRAHFLNVEQNIDIEMFGSTSETGTLRFGLEGAEVTPDYFKSEQGKKIPFASRETLQIHYFYILSQELGDLLQDPDSERSIDKTKLASRFVTMIQLFKEPREVRNAYQVLKDHFAKDDKSRMRLDKVGRYLEKWVDRKLVHDAAKETEDTPKAEEVICKLADQPGDEALCTEAEALLSSLSINRVSNDDRGLRKVYRGLYALTFRVLGKKRGGDIIAVPRLLSKLEVIEKETDPPAHVYMRVLQDLLRHEEPWQLFNEAMA